MAEKEAKERREDIKDKLAKHKEKYDNKRNALAGDEKELIAKSWD